MSRISRGVGISNEVQYDIDYLRRDGREVSASGQESDI